MLCVQQPPLLKTIIQITQCFPDWPISQTEFAGPVGQLRVLYINSVPHIHTAHPLQNFSVMHTHTDDIREANWSSVLSHEDILPGIEPLTS